MKEKLPSSSVADDLFELLVIRRELFKERNAKDQVSPSDIGRCAELKELLELFIIE